MKRLPDEQTLVQQLRNLPEFPLKATEREKMFQAVEMGLSRRSSSRTWKRVAVGAVGLVAAVALIFSLVNHFDGTDEGLAPGGPPVKMRKGPGLVPDSQTIYTDLWYSVSASKMTSKIDLDQEANVIGARLKLYGIPQYSVQINDVLDRIQIRVPTSINMNDLKKWITQSSRLEIKNQQGLLLANNMDLKNNAQVTKDPQTGAEEVEIEFKDPKKFELITQQNIGKQLPIYINGKMVQSPTIQTVITDGKAVITTGGPAGSLDTKALIETINAGVLPYDLVEVKK